MAVVKGIGGIFFKCKEPKKLAQWYEEWLGFKINDYGGTDFKPSEMPEVSYTVWGPFQESTDYFKPSQKDFMFNLIVDNLDDALVQVVQGGAEVIDEVQVYEFGRFGWFMDPEGNKVELWEPK